MALSVCWNPFMLTISICPSYCIEYFFSNVTTTSTSSPCGMMCILACILVLYVFTTCLAIGRRWVSCIVSLTHYCRRKRVWFTGIIHSAVIEQCISNIVVYWWSRLYLKAWHMADWYVCAWCHSWITSLCGTMRSDLSHCMPGVLSTTFLIHSVKNGMLNNHLPLPDH